MQAIKKKGLLVLESEYTKKVIEKIAWYKGCKKQDCEKRYNQIPCFNIQANWVSKSAVRKRLFSILVNGRANVVTRILL